MGEELDRAVARRLAVTDALRDAYAITDERAEIVEVNDAWCRLTGVSREQAIGASPPYPWWPDDPEDQAARMAPIRQALDAGFGEWDVDITDPSGRAHNVRFVTSELRAPGDGARLGFLSILRDQTEQARAEAQLRTIQRLADGLAEAIDLSQVAQVMIREAVPALGAAAGSVGLLVDDETVLVLDTDIEAVVGRGDLVPLHDRPFIARAVRTQELIAIEDADDFRAYDPIVGERMANLGMEAALLVPLTVSGRSLGLLGVVFDEPRRLDQTDRDLCAAIAGQCSLAVERAQRFEHERTVATTLQASFLATGDVDVPGVEVAVRYQPAVDAMDVGGDWYDVIALSDGRMGVAVGDVVGRGLPAASVMGQVRSAMRALALTSDDPADILAGLDRFARHTPAAQVATVAYVVLDPVARTIRYASAGHVPPYVVGPDGGVASLEDGTSWPLDTRRGVARFGAEVEFAPGSTLLLYTDGLVERRGESIDVGLARLHALLAELGRSSSPQTLCDELMAQLVRKGPRTDDVALLCMRTEPTVARSFLRSFPPDGQQLAPLRAELRSWLDPLGVTDDDIHDILLATNEACANAIEHPRDGGTDPLVTVEAVADAREVVLTVTDAGRWRDPSAVAADRGRGFPVMRAVMDQVEVHPRPHGTSVVLRRTVDLPPRPGGGTGETRRA